MFLDPNKVKAYLEDQFEHNERELELEVSATTLRGKVRVGLTTRSLSLPDELSRAVVEEVRERIDGRKIGGHTELGTVVVDTETGEIEQRLEEKYLRPTAKNGS